MLGKRIKTPKKPQKAPNGTTSTVKENQEPEEAGKLEKRLEAQEVSKNGKGHSEPKAKKRQANLLGKKPVGLPRESLKGFEGIEEEKTPKNEVREIENEEGTSMKDEGDHLESGEGGQKKSKGNKTEEQLKKIKAKKREKKKRQRQRKNENDDENGKMKEEAKAQENWVPVPVSTGKYVIEYDDEEVNGEKNETKEENEPVQEALEKKKEPKTKKKERKEGKIKNEDKIKEEMKGNKKQEEEENSSSISSENEEEIVPLKTKAQRGSFSKISICIPDSILEKSQSRELQTYLVSQIARYACIFRVDEIIVLTDHGYKKSASSSFLPSSYIAKNLDYLETPQYLRKMLFPLSPDLKLVGLMAPLEANHHLRTEDYCMYREGVVLDRPLKSGAKGSWVDVGLYKQVQVDRVLPPKTRVTVKINEVYKKGDYFKHLTGSLVSRSEPQEKEGFYWGYSVRIAERFHDIFKECPYKEGYDCQILIDGFSKADLESEIKKISNDENKSKVKHVLLMISPPHGLQALLEADEHSRSHYEKVVSKFNTVGDIVEKVGVKNIWVDVTLSLIYL